MQHLQTPTPRSLGFAQPAEWQPHAATWSSWPANDELWLGWLEPVRQEFAALISTIARFEPVHLNVRDAESEADAKRRLGPANVTYHRVPLDDVWFRDNGPLFVTRNGEVSLVNWRFNAWGNKFDWANDDQVPEYVAQYLGMAHWDVPVVMEGGSLDTNGLGLALTTRQCLLSPERNPQLSQANLEGYLHEYLGLQKLVWLENGLEGDHTDGHIDTITRFAAETTLVSCIETNRADANYATMQANWQALQQHPYLQGFQLVELPLPQNRLELQGERLACTYANFYIGNGFVVVPQYQDPNDVVALGILKDVFVDREVIGLSSRALITGGGSFHCVTQHQPAGQPWKGK